MKELNFSFEKKDYSNFTKDSLGVKRIIKAQLKEFAIPFAIVSLVMSLLLTIKSCGICLDSWSFYVFLFETFASFYLIFSCLVFILILGIGSRNIQKLQQGIDKDTKITINDDVLVQVKEGMSSAFEWSTVKDIYNKKHSILVFISDFQAIFIPKRIFNSENEINELWDYMQTCYNNAKKASDNAQNT